MTPSKTIPIRVTEAEYNILKARADKDRRSLSSYIKNEMFKDG